MRNRAYSRRSFLRRLVTGIGAIAGIVALPRFSPRPRTEAAASSTWDYHAPQWRAAVTQEEA